MKDCSNGGLGLFLAIGLIVSTWIASDAVRDIRMSHQVIKVRGYAELERTSDYVNWTISLKTRHPQLAAAYDKLETDRETTVQWLSQQGIEDREISLAAATSREIRKRDENGYETGEILEFELTQSITVDSSQVDLIATVYGKIDSLIDQGVEIQAVQPSYYYSGINEVKDELLIKATQDAQARARTLAQGSGMSLGALRAARQGPFRIRSARETNISDDQHYDDVAAIGKKITASVTVDYAMQ